MAAKTIEILNTFETIFISQSPYFEKTVAKTKLNKFINYTIILFKTQ